MPKEYRVKQKEMLRQVKEQWGDREPLEGPLRLTILLEGEGRGDIDNIIGALFDTVNKVLWVDDRVNIISSVSVSWKKAPKAESCWRIVIHDA